MRIVLCDHNNVLADLKPHFEIVKTIEEAEAVVVWTEIVVGFAGIVAKTAKKLGKPVIVVQHGRSSTKDYCPPTSYPFTADKICVWGDEDRDRLLKAGIPEKKIELTGTTIFNHLVGRKRHKGINIVFCPTHHDTEIEENFIVADALRKMKANVITKVNEMSSSERFDNPVYSHRDAKDHLEICAKVLSKADLVVAIKDKTFVLLAYALDIPVVIPKVWKDRTMLGHSSPETYSKACDLVELEDLEKAVRENLKNPDKLQKERVGVAMVEGGIHISDPLEKICKVIKSYGKEN